MKIIHSRALRKKENSRRLKQILISGFAFKKKIINPLIVSEIPAFSLVLLEVNKTLEAFFGAFCSSKTDVWPVAALIGTYNYRNIIWDVKVSLEIAESDASCWASASEIWCLVYEGCRLITESDVRAGWLKSDERSFSERTPPPHLQRRHLSLSRA